MFEDDLADSPIAVFVSRRRLLAQIVGILCIFILLDQALDDFLSFVELAETIFKGSFTFVAL